MVDCQDRTGLDSFTFLWSNAKDKHDFAFNILKQCNSGPGNFRPPHQTGRCGESKISSGSLGSLLSEIFRLTPDHQLSTINWSKLPRCVRTMAFYTGVRTVCASAQHPVRCSSVRSIFELYQQHLILNDRAIAFHLTYSASNLGLALRLNADCGCHFVRHSRRENQGAS